MKHVYKGKSKLRILIDTKCDLTGYVDACICCRKPDNSFVAFPATVKDIEKGILFYDVQTAEDIDQSGWWKLWPEVVFDDDRNCAGRAVKLFVYEAGSV